ncbi:uncharacterized protein BO80DRAFT_469880 [Aspergillus ibericus CBS 121593]|uniref:Protein kinase domain-containing protein n=1 Tax=Aspergillus ibericus CBS 121593 TaxID=1448316 RepID=A0A395GHG0_9EURO|nr:hypothetical protein BO80DRAFT_469880 [Aspergillus ibericus CBS 121593]RAK94831.1 hypothetical protein BO80DRAFT_469880 [Aspergillus ibericus CBS 121593]
MGPVDGKRATQFIADKVPLLEQPPPDTVATVPSLPVPRYKPKETIPSSVRLAKRPTVSSPAEPSRKIIRGQPRGLALPEATRLSGNNVGSDLVIRDEPPWDTFKKFYECDLAGTVAVCVRCSGRRAVWAIRQYSRKDTDRILKTLRSTRHGNVDSVWQCFRTPDSLYTVSKFHPLTLDHVVACKAFPNQQQLAAILSQFIDGLSYLVSQNLQHTSLDCSSILMSLEGEIQIARIDCWTVRPPGRVQADDLAPIARVMMQLMQKYAKDDGAVGIDNLDRWQKCPAAIEFLSATTSAGSFEDLKKHLLSEVRWSPSDLIGIAWFALISARTFYSYTPPSDAET